MSGGRAPSIAALTSRLAETPADFLRADVAVAALVSDLLVAHRGLPLTVAAAEAFQRSNWSDGGERNALLCVSVAVWLLYHSDLLGVGDADRVQQCLIEIQRDLAEHVRAGDLLSDPDRREELARRVLHSLGLVPDGETAEQAADRLTTLDSGERARVLAATRQAERRAAEVREAMHAKAAAEAAAKASRE